MSKIFKVQDLIIVITGGAGLLGSNYCRHFSLNGAKVIMADLIDANPIEAAKKIALETSGECIGIQCDVSVEEDVVNLFEVVLKKFGRVDVVVNNAAATGEHLLKKGAVFEKFENYPLNMWEEVIAVNLTGAFLVAREAGKAFAKNKAGSLINVSSTYGVVGPDHRIYDGEAFSSFASYSASKAGIHGLTRWLATYWGNANIRVNTLVPGGVWNGHTDSFNQSYSQRTPLGRMANPNDMLGMLHYLASNSSSYSTGQQFFVDGGWTAV